MQKRNSHSLLGRRDRRHESGRDTTLEEQLLNECGAMVRHAAAAGKRIPPSAAEIISKLVAERATHSSTNSDSPWQVAQPADLRDLATAHQMLSKLVAPATPQSITVLNEEKPNNRFVKLLGPVRLVRWMMILALLFLASFLILFTTDVQSLEETARAQGQAPSGLSRLWSALYVLSAAGLGAIFANLFRANARIESGLFDPKEESSYSASIVMGMISGVILARVISSNFDELNTFTEPLLALLGGFAAPAVHRILNRLVETIEALVQGNASDQIAAQAEVAAARVTAVAETDRARLAARALRLREEAARSGSSETLQSELRSLIEDLLPEEDAVLRILEYQPRTL
jgi:hypothetical protein